MPNYKVLKSEVVFKGKMIDLKVDEIENIPSGNKGIREVAKHPGGAVAVAITDGNKILLVKQFRYPHRQWIIELPAGKLDKGEDPKICAARELQEETGYTAGKISKLGEIYTSPGFCDETLHIYLAENLTKGDHHREEGEEDMELLELTLDEIKEMIMSGEIIDAKTICGIYMYSNL